MKIRIRRPKPNSPAPRKPEYGVVVRWRENLAQSFTPISNYFLDNYHRLKPPIRHTEAIFLIHLFRHKWNEEPPYPSWNTLAEYMGITTTAVRNIARGLVQKGFLRKVQQVAGTKTNKFYLERLLDALTKMQAADAAVQAKIDASVAKKE